VLKLCEFLAKSNLLSVAALKPTHSETTLSLIAAVTGKQL